MKNKNIAFLIANIDNAGGTERVSLALADFLCENGYNVTFFSYQAKGKPFFKHDPRIRIIGFNRNVLMMKFIRHFYPTNNQLLRFLIKMLCIDVIIDVDMGQAMFSSVAIQGTKCKHITWNHFNYYDIENSETRKAGFECCKKTASKLVVLTKKDQECFVGKEGLPENFVEQIYNPLTIEKDTFTEHNQKKVIAVGRLGEEKGFDMLLYIWSKIEEYHNDWVLEIYGSGAEEEKLKNLIVTLKIKRAFLRGQTKDVEGKMEDASIYVLTSRHEGFVLVLLEAVAMSLPIVSFDCPQGPSEIITDGVNGFLIEPGNLEAFAEKLSLLMNDKDKRNQFGKASFEVSKKFKKKMIFPKWVELIENL